MRTAALAILLPVTMLMGCAPSAQPQPSAPTLPFITATLAATPGATVTTFPVTATASLTPTPHIGVTTTQLNVRSQPQSSGAPLGLIPASARVLILGKDPGGHWYQIAYAGGTAGIGWVASEYVTVEDTQAVPVIGGGSAQPLATVREQINVRSGAGLGFESLGILSPRDAVRLTGRDSTGTWLQIDFAAGPEGKGWVAGSFLDAPDVDQLPIVGSEGQVAGTATPTGIPPVQAPTLMAARDDGDSADAPAVDVEFSPSGVGSIIYASDVSAPEGDATDWIRFTPYSSSVIISLACNGNGDLRLELRQAGASAAEDLAPGCGQSRRLRLEEGKPYTLQLTIAPRNAPLTLVAYAAGIYDAAIP